MPDARDYGDEVWRYWSGMHRLLLRLAGRVPDHFLNEMREWLAAGDVYKVPEYVAGAIGDLGLSVDVGDVALMREVTRAGYGSDPVWLRNAGAEFAISPEIPATGHRFSPVSAEVLATDAQRIPSSLDLTGRPDADLWTLPPELAPLEDLALRLTDVRDQNLVPGDGLDEHIVSVSRAWRFPAEGPPAGAMRVALIEVAEYAPAWQIAEEILGRALLWEKQPDPDLMVEVYWTGTELPPYHREALAHSARFWEAS